jgi:hypothetical protein
VAENQSNQTAFYWKTSIMIFGFVCGTFSKGTWKLLYTYKMGFISVAENWTCPRTFSESLQFRTEK